MNKADTSTDRRWTGRHWFAVAAAVVVAAAIAVLSVTLFFSGSKDLQPGVTPSPSVTPNANPTATDSNSPPPSGEAPPTAPEITGASSAPPAATPSTSPRKQPTENDDSPPRETKAPIEITAEATPAKGIEVHLLRIESVNGEAVIPGEVGGPAVRITVEVTNSTSEDFATPSVVMNLYKGKALAPAGSLLKPGGKPFPATIASGDSAVGVYLFSVDKDQRDDVTVEVDLAVGTPIILFHGSIN